MATRDNKVQAILKPYLYNKFYNYLLDKSITESSLIINCLCLFFNEPKLSFDKEYCLDSKKTKKRNKRFRVTAYLPDELNEYLISKIENQNSKSNIIRESIILFLTKKDY